MAQSSRMIALLGLLAVAGYQNRDKIGEWLGRVTGKNYGGSVPRDPSLPEPEPASGGGLLSGLGSLFGGGSGGGLAGGLGELIDNFTGKGHGETAKSWVETGPNRDLSPDQLAESLDPETLDDLSRQTGLSREELLKRLASVLPTAVDKMTPEGRLPTEDEVARWGSAAA